jgi:hypothetical protein
VSEVRLEEREHQLLSYFKLKAYCPGTVVLSRTMNVPSAVFSNSSFASSLPIFPKYLKKDLKQSHWGFSGDHFIDPVLLCTAVSFPDLEKIFTNHLNFVRSTSSTERLSSDLQI